MRDNELREGKETRRILVIDDDPDIGLMIKMMLEFRGYWVTVIDRAENTLDIIVTNKIDLIIMDMLLSGVNGVDVCMEIKAFPQTRHIPVIMISAHPNARETCLAAGADEFVSKPFDMEEILAKIKNLIDRSNASPGSPS